MRRVSALCALTAVLAVGAEPSFADNPAEWNAAVAAMTAVDPAMPVPPYDPAHIIAVGGGTFAGGENLGLSSPNFAFGATVTPSGAQGAMTVVGSVPGVTLHADVMCVAAAATSGDGAIATVIGHVTNPPLEPSTEMVFTLTDSGAPDGTGDFWAGQLTSDFPCIPLPGAGTFPIVGNITIHVS